MKISISTIAFNDYGQFLPQWLDAVRIVSPEPDEIVVVLGRNHNTPNLDHLKAKYPKAQFYEYEHKPTFGKLRNIGISKTSSEWVFFVSVDDIPVHDAIRTFKRAIKKEPDADYICAEWIRLGKYSKRFKSPYPQEMAERMRNGERAGFIIPHSPFKRWLWEKHPYAETDLPNYDFVMHCMLNGANFIKGDKPTTIYKMRKESHSQSILKKDSAIRRQAFTEKNKFHKAILEKYQ